MAPKLKSGCRECGPLGKLEVSSCDQYQSCMVILFSLSHEFLMVGFKVYRSLEKNGIPTQSVGSKLLNLFLSEDIKFLLSLCSVSLVNIDAFCHIGIWGCSVAPFK